MVWGRGGGGGVRGVQRGGGVGGLWGGGGGGWWGRGPGHPEARDEEGVGVEAPVVVVGLHGGVLVEPEGEEADHVPEAEGEALVPPRDEARVEMRGQPQRDLQA